MALIYINGISHSFDLKTPLLDILKEISLDQSRGIAVAVNNEVVAKSDWPDYKISDKDQITIIKATQGG